MENALVLKTKLDTKNFTNEIKKLEEDAKNLATILKGRDKLDYDDVVKYEAQLEKVNNQLKSLYKKQNDINNQGFKKVQDTLGNVNKSASNVSKSIVRWGLALIGVRSAMTLIRSSMSTLSQYDENLAKDIEYIRYVLAMTLKPVIEAIVDLIFTALQYVNYLAQAWFGVNLFANASAESMENTTKNIQKSQKEMAKLNKEMFGFDKINKLSKDKSSDTDTGGGVPRVDLSKMLGEGDIPEWLRWFKENGPSLIPIITGIAGALVMLKLGFGGLQALGIGIAIMGIIALIQDVSSYLNKLNGDLENNGTSWKDFGQIIMDIGVIIAGVGIALGSIPVIFAGIVTMILGLILYFYNDIVGFLQNLKYKQTELIKWIESETGVLFAFFLGIFDALGDFVIDTFIGFYKPIKDVFDGIMFFLKGDFENGFKSIFRGIGNYFIGIINRMIDALNAFLSPLRSTLKLIGRVTGQDWSVTELKIPRIPYFATGAIINYPGKGVPVGLGMAGERGQEGILPLSDETAMDRLGERIGKYISVNIDLTTELDGRVLSRQLKKVNNEDTFARNGG